MNDAELGLLFSGISLVAGFLVGMLVQYLRLSGRLDAAESENLWWLQQSRRDSDPRNWH